MKAELVPEDGGRPIPITRDVTVVGRREYCDVRLDHPSLSKRHAVLVKTEGLLILRDLASTNGTKVKGQRIRWAALLPDDRISFGTLKFRVYLGSDDALAPSERRLGTSKVPAAFPAPTPPATPVVAGRIAAIGMLDAIIDDGGSDDWRDAMTSGARPLAPSHALNDHELIIEDDDVIELE